jgi:outer membrane lipoprotein
MERLINTRQIAEKPLTARLWLLSAMVTLLLTGCGGVPAVPPELENRVDRTVSFLQVKASPLSYKGRLIVVGGMVLAAKPLKEGTRIEVLQLPIDRDDEPFGYLTDSQGRFMVFQKEFVDPATIPIGTRVTVAGEVTGSMGLMIEEIEYTYPTLDGKALTVWPPKVPVYFRPYPYFGAYWGPYWGPYLAPFTGR